MSKRFPYTILILFLILSLNIRAQTEPIATITVKSCSQRLKELQSEVARGNKTNKKIEESAATVVNAGTSVVINTLSTSIGMIGSTAIGLGAQIGLTLIIVGTKTAIKKHRENIALIFEGAAIPGGNVRTKKLWKLANKKNRNAFKDITYEQFLNAIHKADLSGEACQFEDIPERRDLIGVLVDGKELFDEAPMLGEKEQSRNESVIESERYTIKNEGLGYPTYIESPNSVGSKEY
jgi:hypothetical protein